jgi:hypothetical protein
MHFQGEQSKHFFNCSSEGMRKRAEIGSKTEIALQSEQESTQTVSHSSFCFLSIGRTSFMFSLPLLAALKEFPSTNIKHASWIHVSTLSSASFWRRYIAIYTRSLRFLIRKCATIGSSSHGYLADRRLCP